VCMRQACSPWTSALRAQGRHNGPRAQPTACLALALGVLVELSQFYKTAGPRARMPAEVQVRRVCCWAPHKRGCEFKPCALHTTGSCHFRTLCKTTDQKPRCQARAQSPSAQRQSSNARKSINACKHRVPTCHVPPTLPTLAHAGAAARNPGIR